ncbi:Protein of unknown function [Faunimonas pinastri]|uniref:DUF1194 domain-containing protein n=1 Tax=Faunimonas pinastri TaxID=1855383 RepID=A0A1H9KKX4_9HYPH|nr:DUF1194 domain-containing protein [Faunimonas pinastri]SEQ99790.1 Protein of unknown function [Faunimonas pinastri]
MANWLVAIGFCFAGLVPALSLAAPASAAPALTQDRPATVDLELVLAVDVSFSMDVEEQTVQRQGYMDAFRSPEVIKAIRSGDLGRIAVTYMEWAGSETQTVVVPWTVIDGEQSAAAFADRLATEAPERRSRTSISGALIFGQTLFGADPEHGTRRAIDVSGDGPNNQGIPVTQARDAVVAGGIAINGLPIMLQRAYVDFFSIPNLDAYYRDCVIGGDAAFILKIEHKEEFVDAIRRKLVLEISGLQPDAEHASKNGDARVIPVQFKRREPTDCMIGEKLMQQRWGIQPGR